MKIIREHFLIDGYFCNLAEEKSQKRTIKIREMTANNSLSLSTSCSYKSIILPEIYYYTFYMDDINYIRLIDKQYNVLLFNNSVSTSCIPGRYLGIQECIDIFWNTPFDVTRYVGMVSDLIADDEIANLLRMKNENH